MNKYSQAKTHNYNKKTPFFTPKKHLIFRILVIFLLIAIPVCLIWQSRNKHKSTDTTQEISYESSNITDPDDIYSPKIFDVHTPGDIIKYVSVTPVSETEITQAPDYTKRIDNEFGFKIDSPNNFYSPGVAVSDATRLVFSTLLDEHAKFIISAGYNKVDLTPQDLCDEFIKLYGKSSDYKQVNKTGFEISLSDNNCHHYAYYNVEKGVIRGFEFHFTGDEYYNTYSKYINHIKSSFSTCPPAISLTTDYAEEALCGDWYFDEGYGSEKEFKTTSIRKTAKNRAVLEAVDSSSIIIFVGKNKAIDSNSYQIEENQSCINVYTFDQSGEVLRIDCCDAVAYFDSGTEKKLGDSISASRINNSDNNVSQSIGSDTDKSVSTFKETQQVYETYKYALNTFYNNYNNYDIRYTLFDIDNNSIPELIYNIDDHQYHIYSFNDNNLVNSGEIDAKYGIVKYEDMLLVHDGGSGYSEYCQVKLNDNLKIQQDVLPYLSCESNAPISDSSTYLLKQKEISEAEYMKIFNNIHDVKMFPKNDLSLLETLK